MPRWVRECDGKEKEGRGGSVMETSWSLASDRPLEKRWGCGCIARGTAVWQEKISKTGSIHTRGKETYEGKAVKSSLMVLLTPEVIDVMGRAEGP